jgi:hypothetical protein
VKTTIRIPLQRLFNAQEPAAPLAAFRFLFGAIMVLSTLRFMLKGWVYDLYVAPQLFFTYYGFEWIRPLPETGMYLLFSLLTLAFLGIALGAFYRLSAFTAFMVFTYIELIDKTNYLNHYYFVSIVCFLLLFLPAHRSFSLDALRGRCAPLKLVPSWTINTLRFQLGLVYFFAGVAKLNTDWLLHAMPLNIWLKSYIDVPVVGPFLGTTEAAYAFSWFGLVYDLSIPFLLMYRKTRPAAYLAVVAFHLTTAALFPIGMFPWIMLLSTLIFFPDSFHERWMRHFSFLSSTVKETKPALPLKKRLPISISSFAPYVVGLFLFLQLALPLRHLLYPGNLLWTEEGYRFSWRVMLMEKAGYAIFHVEDLESGRKWEVNNYDYLTPNQEKMMATQADMLLQFSHFLKKTYAKEGVDKLRITVENYVSLNGRKSCPMIDDSVDFTQLQEGFSHKSWILPYPHKNKS